MNIRDHCYRIGQVNDGNLASLWSLMAPCHLCPRKCGVNRIAGERGFCGVASDPRISSFGPHFGEEPELVGQGGSGTIFMSSCSLRCVFCQNSSISIEMEGIDVSVQRLSDVMLRLQTIGCENVNLVTPTHFAAPIAEAVLSARSQGLTLPIVYNCGGYESPEVIALLDGIVDVYLPDFKTLDSRWATEYLHAPDYPQAATESLKVMYAQVGGMVLDARLAKKGLIVRHLAMPGMTADGMRIIDLVSDVAPHAVMNIMGQYRPAHVAHRYNELATRTPKHEIEHLRRYAGTRHVHLTY